MQNNLCYLQKLRRQYWLHETEVLELDRQKYQNDVATKIQTSVNDTFVILQSKLEELIKNKIDEKMIKIKNFVETLKKKSETLSIISKSCSQSVQERQREARSKNIIIHGFTEAPDINELIDIKAIKKLFNVLQLDGTPESTERLGNRNEEIKRQIRIKMKSLNEKKMVMDSLDKLKPAPENLRKINVTDDFPLMRDS